MKTKQTPLQIAHRILEDMGYGHIELHHYRGREKLSAPWDDVILLSVLPVSKQAHTEAHMMYGTGDAMSKLLQSELLDIKLLIIAMDEQIKIMIARGMV